MKENTERPLLWMDIADRQLADCKIFKVIGSLREGPSGRRVERYYLDSPDWVTVIPLIKQGDRDKFLMVRQYRHGSRSVTWEFPAGMVDSGELPEDAVHRELLEETGYRAGEMIRLGEVNPNSAIMNNTQYIYTARELELVAEQNLDEHEDVDFSLFPVEEVFSMMGRGLFSNGTMMTALAFFHRWQEENSV